jgi:hypothetical protein
MPSARIIESIIAEVRPAKKIDRIRNIWGDIQKLREARLTYKQIAAQLPKYGIEGVSLNEFHCICYRIRKGPPVTDQEFPQNFGPSQPSSNSNCRLGGDFSGAPGLVCERTFLIPSASA